jgi:hypothetical protein
MSKVMNNDGLGRGHTMPGHGIPAGVLLQFPSILGKPNQRRTYSGANFMSNNYDDSRNRDILLENFAAELTCAAYAVALRRGLEDEWLDLELELWEALKETVKKQGQDSPHFSAVPFVCDWA